VASFTPGAIGVTQATNALALKTCCDVPRETTIVPRETTIAYSTAQQLIVTAWNIGLPTVLVLLVFGWTGGKLLVGDAYTDARGKVGEQKEQRAAKRTRRHPEQE
jgi:hypothetical protein